MTWLKTYTRETITLTDPETEEDYSAYDIPHPERIHVVDSITKTLHLSTEIKNALGRNDFIVQCNGEDVDVIFPEEPTSAEKTTINSIVSNHKTNS